jgi:protein-tyrosine sulfotransferase
MKFEVKKNFFIILLILPVLSVVYFALKSNNNKLNDLSSIIIIGGRPRSGTTLMRAIIDTDNTVKCGIETKIIPRLLHFISNWWPNLKYVNLKKHDVDLATKTFISNIIIGRNISPTQRQCIKDPDVIEHILYLYQFYPNAKFIFMVKIKQ